MNITERNITDIKPYDNNPRNNDAAVTPVMNSIREFGFKVPIVIDKGGIIIAGHTRYRAALELKLKKVPCVVADDLTDQQVKAFRLADNKVSEFAKWDISKLNIELGGIFDLEMESFGFDIGLDSPADDLDDALEEEAVEWGVIGDEDPEFINGSYAFAQKYIHDLDAWRALPTEMQEKFIGRRKFSDIELEDDEKDEAAHNVVAQDNRDGEEHKIVRMNVPFAQPGHGVRGTYFIGYARYWDVTKTMLTNMFTQNDKLLDYSKPTTGMLFFIPSLDTLDAIAEEEI